MKKLYKERCINQYIEKTDLKDLENSEININNKWCSE